MSEGSNAPGGFDEEMSAYLQTFLDETEEQLDDLVETLLLLERDSSDTENLNESFRLIHSIKGSAGMMGLDPIAMLTHHLENRFERFRSGTEILDATTMNLVLRCVDFLRQCADRLRGGETLGSPSELLEELRRLENESQNQDVDAESPAAETQSGTPKPEPTNPTPEEQPTPPASTPPDGIRVVIRFREGLALVDLKAQLIVNRLNKLGDIPWTQPALDAIDESQQLTFELILKSDCDPEQIREAAEVDGVEAIDFAADVPNKPVIDPPDTTSVDPRSERSGESDHASPAATPDSTQIESPAAHDVEPAQASPVETHATDVPATPPDPSRQDQRNGLPDDENVSASEVTDHERSPQAESQPVAEAQPPVEATPQVEPKRSAKPNPSESPANPTEKQTRPVNETMRVGIDRLDNLMNLAGELVVNRAQFVQIAEQLTPLQQRSKTINRMREFGDALRRTIDGLESQWDLAGNQRALADQLRAGLQLLDQNSHAWEHERRYFEKFGEAIDQLSRVSQGLQRGVLETRMVPVGPLFNRFKRVVRDLALERNKQVELRISGEKTELDKRMIDELGDPLIHLVRNAIDHGLESTDERLAKGKEPVGSIELEAAHSGNNVYIYVRDDGGGIEVRKIKAKLIQNGVLTEMAANELSDEQALEYIWHPGFSTADRITDVSGRGVGMDVVQDRVQQLNGGLSVDSTPGSGTQFTIRLPLTLAIINCLLIRLRSVVFSMPIDHVREIVSVPTADVIRVRNQRTIDVRNEIIPLMSIDEIFDWNNPEVEKLTDASHDEDSPPNHADVVILQSGGRAIGLPVDELLGSQDMVIKSLADNFVDISGLSGASILGDGSVCLMLDVGAIFRMISGTALRSDAQGTGF